MNCAIFNRIYVWKLLIYDVISLKYLTRLCHRVRWFQMIISEKRNVYSGQRTEFKLYLKLNITFFKMSINHCTIYYFVHGLLQNT